MANTVTEQLNTMYTTTWYLRLKGIVDQIFNATPFWYLMNKKGKLSNQTGGRSIEIPLQYAKNSTVQFIGRGGTVDLAATDALTVVHCKAQGSCHRRPAFPQSTACERLRPESGEPFVQEFVIMISL